MSPPARESILIVTNPTSGRGQAKRWTRSAERRLRDAGTEVVIAEERGQAGAILSARPSGWTALWVIGGDGTLNDLLQVLPPDPPPLVLLPTGTGNVVARDLGLPRRLLPALAVAQGPGARPFDLGRVNGHRFAFMVSVGLDASLAASVAAHRRGPMRKSDWLRASFACRHEKEEAFEVAVDGRPLGRFAYAALFNCGLYAGGFRVCPQARFDDGLLHVLLLKDPIRPRWARVVFAALRHRPEGLPDALLLPARRVEVRGAPAVQVDGDPFPADPATATGRAIDLDVGIEPAAVRFHVGAPSGG